MIEKITVCHSKSLDPYYNLALEEVLLESVQQGESILYLWKNAATVVIGHNQNPWKECRISHLEEDNGHLARRLSGGGAVYHDIGNLNFTFLCCDKDYDLKKNLSVIVEACRANGIAAEISGRNDILVQGCKFSGNAFYHTHGNCYHHGTMMVNVDLKQVERYLSPSKAKLKAKGVESVRSRVINLCELAPNMTCKSLSQDMVKAFEKVFGLQSRQIQINDLDQEDIERLRQRNASKEWLYGRDLPLNFSCSDRFSWGELTMELGVERGRVDAIKVWTDSMDWQLSGVLEQTLIGKDFSMKQLTEALNATELNSDIRQDIISLLAKQEI